MQGLALLVVALMVAQIVAFRPTSHASSRSSRALKMSDNGKGRLTELCEITKEACDVVQPMLESFYSQIRVGTGESSTAKFKSDATFFSIADGIVQHMFIEYLFAGDKFFDIVGEEDESKINIMETPYTVDELTVPEEFEDMIDATYRNVPTWQLSKKF